jgi:hypothetical protein
VAHSEGGMVEVDGGGALRGRRGRGRRWWHDNDQEWHVDSLRNRTAAVRSEVEVEAVACSEARDEAVACSGVGIEDSRWCWWHDSSRVTEERESVEMKIF